MIKETKPCILDRKKSPYYSLTPKGSLHLLFTDLVYYFNYFQFAANWVNPVAPPPPYSPPISKMLWAKLSIYYNNTMAKQVKNTNFLTPPGSNPWKTQFWRILSALKWKKRINLWLWSWTWKIFWWKLFKTLSVIALETHHSYCLWKYPSHIWVFSASNIPDPTYTLKSLHLLIKSTYNSFCKKKIK